MADEPPPLPEVGTDDERAEDAQDGQYDDAEDVGSADFCCGNLDASRQSNTDTEEDRGENIDQAADDQAHAEARGSGVDDIPSRNGCSRGVLSVRPGAKPTRRTGGGERSRRRTTAPLVYGDRLIWRWIRSARCRDPAGGSGSADGPGGGRGPMDCTPCRVGCHRARHDPEGFLRVAVLFALHWNQAGQRCDRSGRVVEDGPFFGSPCGRLGVQRRGLEGRDVGRLKLGWALDRRVLRSVLPSCHEVIVDAAVTPPECAEPRPTWPQNQERSSTDHALISEVGLRERNGYA